MDRVKKCKDCGENFTFTTNEQKFYEEKGFPDPKRCKSCRKTRKIKREEVKQ